MSDFAPLSGCHALACKPRGSDLQCGREMAPRNFVDGNHGENRQGGIVGGRTVALVLEDCVQTSPMLYRKVWSRPHHGSCRAVTRLRFETCKGPRSGTTFEVCFVHECARQSRSACVVGRFQTLNVHANTFRSSANLRADDPSCVMTASRHQARRWLCDMKIVV